MEEMKTSNIDCGEDGLTQYIVGPARMKHIEEGCPLNEAEYVNIDNAMRIARQQSQIRNLDMCVYRLDTIARFNYR